MKKIIAALIIILLVTMSKNAVCGNADLKTRYYPLTTKVIKVENDTVTIKDNNGFIWEFKGSEDWEVKDICTCIMNDKGTQTIFDDEIVTTKYDGR